MKSESGDRMVVVSDTSPLRALHHLGLIHILASLFDEVLVPRAVAAELAAGSARLAGVPLDAYPFIQIKGPAMLDPRVAAEVELDPGEMEAISLALEIGADTLLMDEAEGRRVAAELGLVRVGVLGLLADAKDAGLVTAVGPLMDRLRTEINFFVSDAVRRDVLRRAGE